jgi:hypothetical protein
MRTGVEVATPQLLRVWGEGEGGICLKMKKKIHILSFHMRKQFACITALVGERYRTNTMTTDRE